MAECLATRVWVGAADLACVAGIVKQAITHPTGNTPLRGPALVAAHSGSTSQQWSHAAGAAMQ